VLLFVKKKCGDDAPCFFRKMSIKIFPFSSFLPFFSSPLHSSKKKSFHTQVAATERNTSHNQYRSASENEKKRLYYEAFKTQASERSRDFRFSRDTNKIQFYIKESFF